MPQVEVPSRYRVPTRGEALIDVEGGTVRECIEAVESRYPGFQELVLDRHGDLNRYVKLFVNGEQLPRDAIDAPLAPSDRLQVLASAAGG